MRSIKILFIILLCLLPASLFANDVSPTVQSDINWLATPGAVLTYTGIFLETAGIALGISGYFNFMRAYPLMIVGIVSFLTGVVCDAIIGPILSLNAYIKLKKDMVISSSANNNSILYYGVSWGVLAGGILLSLPFHLIMPKNYALELTLRIFGAIILGLTYTATYSLRSISATIPLLKVKL